MGKDVMAAGNICTVRANLPEEQLRIFLPESIAKPARRTKVQRESTVGPVLREKL
jgi:hypothetical protein